MAVYILRKEAQTCPLPITNAKRFTRAHNETMQHVSLWFGHLKIRFWSQNGMVGFSTFKGHFKCEFRCRIINIIPT